MIIIQLQGGLGNQMFQYAAANALVQKNNDILLLDESLLIKHSARRNGFTPRKYALGIFRNISNAFAPNEMIESFFKGEKKNLILKHLGLPYKKIFYEKSYSFDHHYFSQKPPVLLNGYFQSENYFSSISGFISKQFSFDALDEEDSNISVKEFIQKNNTVSVHVRRGDYVKDPKTSGVHGYIGDSYYLSAFEYIQQQVPDVRFIFFSDDAEWVDETFVKHRPNSMIVTNNQESNSWKDMYLMSMCNHHIIANSSFSWWGAWLNRKPDKVVVAPRCWYVDAKLNEQAKDIIPGDWIKL